VTPQAAESSDHLLGDLRFAVTDKRDRPGHPHLAQTLVVQARRRVFPRLRRSRTGSSPHKRSRALHPPYRRSTLSKN